ncbi:MAG: alanine racemase [Gammaproteobacteria bacterium]|nr:alanine racemase [Gammaproteobacteria bacterium]
MGFHRGPRALIDLSALRHNLHRAREASQGRKVVAVIKANAYGHGMLRAASALESEADALAVARVTEGRTLRESGVQKPILVLEGCFDTDEARLAADLKLDLTIHHASQLTMLEQLEADQKVSCWFKLDSGMHRLGFSPEKGLAAYQKLRALSCIDGPVRLMTHLANADDRNDSATEDQLTLFRQFAQAVDSECSLANSAAILGWPQTHADWVRPGIMLYGASPFTNGRGDVDGLQPVMTLQSQLIAINHYPQGAPVGYGGSWCCPEAMAVGVVAIGYGDGYPRHAPSGTPVLINGQRAPLAGRVSMDMLTVDLRNHPEVRVGDSVVLWGRGLPAEEIAEQAGTITYELFCGVTSRVLFEEI